MADQYTQQDPTTQYPQPNFGEQKLEHPGLEPEMQPKPDYGYETYRGSGRLEGKAPHRSAGTNLNFCTLIGVPLSYAFGQLLRRACLRSLALGCYPRNLGLSSGLHRSTVHPPDEELVGSPT